MMVQLAISLVYILKKKKKILFVFPQIQEHDGMLLLGKIHEDSNTISKQLLEQSDE